MTSAGFGQLVAIAALWPDGRIVEWGGDVKRWPVSSRRSALLWLGNRPRKLGITLAYVPATTTRERFEDLSARRPWETSPHRAYGGLRLMDV
jgi:hypothetical protein